MLRKNRVLRTTFCKHCKDDTVHRWGKIRGDWQCTRCGKWANPK